MDSQSKTEINAHCVIVEEHCNTYLVLVRLYLFEKRIVLKKQMRSKLQISFFIYQVNMSFGIKNNDATRGLINCLPL